MYGLLPALALLFHLTCYSQVDQEKLDSLTRSIDSSKKVLRNWQDSFTKMQDSIYEARVSKAERTPEKTTGFIVNKTQHAKRQAATYIVIGLGLLMLLFIGLLRKRRPGK